MSEERDRQIRNFISQLVLLDEEPDDLLSQQELREIVLELGYDESDLERLERTAKAHRTRADNYRQIGRLNRAASEYSVALAMEPEDIPTQCAYAEVLFERHKAEGDPQDLKLALRLAEQCVEIEPGFNPAYQLMGEIKRFKAPPAAPPTQAAPEPLRSYPAPKPSRVEPAAQPAPPQAAEPEAAVAEAGWEHEEPVEGGLDGHDKIGIAVAIFILGFVLPVTGILVYRAETGKSSASYLKKLDAQEARKRRLEEEARRNEPQMPYTIEAPDGMDLEVYTGIYTAGKNQRVFDITNASQDVQWEELKLRVLLYDADDEPYMALRYPSTEVEEDFYRLEEITDDELRQRELGAKNSEEEEGNDAAPDPDQPPPAATPTILPGDTIRVHYPPDFTVETWEAARAQIIVEHVALEAYTGEGAEEETIEILHDEPYRRTPLRQLAVVERKFDLPSDGEYADDERIWVQPEFALVRGAHPDAEYRQPAFRFDFFDADRVHIQSIIYQPFSVFNELDYLESTRPFRPTFHIKSTTRSYKIFADERR